MRTSVPSGFLTVASERHRSPSDQPAESRKTQSINVTKKTTPLIHKPPALLGVQPSQRPHHAEAINQMALPTASTPRSVPPALASSDATTSYRARYDQEVVMPQVGQRLPNIKTNEQGGNPKRSCVPWPRGSGSRQRATPISANSPIPSKMIHIR